MDEDASGRRTVNIEDEYIDAWRRDLLSDLPGLLRRAVRAYQRFTADQPPEDAKGFVAYQTGCRAALTHIHLLVKLADWARASGVEAASHFDPEQLDRLVREAEAALRADPIDEG